MGSQNVDRPQIQEQFSPKLFTIILSIHLLAIPAFFHVTYINVLAWIICHYIFGTIGASIGLHRYCSHRSFEYKSNIFKIFVTALATLCFQGGPVFWAASHREHHRFSENFGDPHDANRGFWWSHVGWLFYLNPNGFSYLKSLRVTSDLKKDPIINFFEVNSIKINFIFLAGLFVACYAYDNLGLFFWLGPLRIVTVWHSTWLINSYTHGVKFFRGQKSEIKNSLFMSLIIGGDGDHLYHHQNPSKVKHSFRKYHLDYGYLLICGFKILGLVEFKNDREVKSHAITRKFT